jgi:hypothetical protein
VRPRELAVGVVTTAAAVVAMWFDHMRGLDPGYDDPAAFFISVGVVIALAVGLFGFVVPRVRSDPARAARGGMITSAISVLTLALLWLGVPWVVAGAGIAMGLIGLDGERRRLAAGAIAIGAITLVLCGVGSDWSSEG